MTNDELGLWLNKIMEDHKEQMAVADSLKQAEAVLKSADDHIISILSRMVSGHDQRRADAVRLLHDLHARIIGSDRYNQEQIGVQDDFTLPEMYRANLAIANGVPFSFSAVKPYQLPRSLDCSTVLIR